MTARRLALFPHLQVIDFAELTVQPVLLVRDHSPTIHARGNQVVPELGIIWQSSILFHDEVVLWKTGWFLVSDGVESLVIFLCVLTLSA